MFSFPLHCFQFLALLTLIILSLSMVSILPSWAASSTLSLEPAKTSLWVPLPYSLYSLPHSLVHTVHLKTCVVISWCPANKVVSFQRFGNREVPLYHLCLPLIHLLFASSPSFSLPLSLTDPSPPLSPPLSLCLLCLKIPATQSQTRRIPTALSVCPAPSHSPSSLD